ncbi:autotransporter-associated beta strand repeat-containing protein [Fontivita pretiosa]|uniref:beta strand repeat-containing protein n=1 Tax=Fontivita pretiosa TaxID=2989684 RepID=UPI003D16DFDE
MLLGAVLGAAVLSTAPMLAQAQISGSWISPLSGNWSDGVNWSSNPLYPDSGGVATFAMPAGLGQSPVVWLDLPNITLAGIVFDSPIRYIVSTGTASNTITLNGLANLDVIRSNGGSPSLIPAGHTLAVPIAGNAGLTKTGQGVLFLGVANTYSGGTRINGGVLAAGEDVFGTAAASISINSATLRSVFNGISTSRQIAISGTSTLEAISPMFLDGPLSGSGMLNITGGSGVRLSAASSYMGSLNLYNGSLMLSVSGSLPNVSSIVSSGSITLDNGAGGSLDRIGNTTSLTMRGASLAVTGFVGSDLSETIGDATFSGGVSFVAAQPASATQGVTLSFNSASRADHATVFFRGNNLGAAPGGNVGNIRFTTPPALIGGGGAPGSTNISIIPWAWGATGNLVASNAATNSLVTYGPNGIRPLNLATEYTTSLPAGATSDNVRLTSHSILNTESTVNALVMASLSGGPLSLSGNGTLTLGSGVLLNLAGIMTVDPAINFGSAEGMIIATSLLTIGGKVSGSGGLTKSGFGGATLSNAANDYTGQTTIVAGNITYVGDVHRGVPGPLGADSSPIVLAPGGIVSPFARLWAGKSGTTIFNRDLIAAGSPTGICGFGTSGPAIDQVVVMNGNIFVQTHLQMQGSSVQPMIINGTISGPGMLSDGFDSAQILNAANTYSGGTEIREGLWLVGNDAALGSGTVWFASPAGDGRLGAFGAARTIANPIVFTNPPTFAGDQNLTLSGPLDLAGRIVTHTINSTASVTYSGMLINGGLNKAGAGTLVLAADNAHTGGTTVVSGPLLVSHPDALGEGPLVVNPAGEAIAQPNLPQAVRVVALSVAVGGSFDLNNNPLVIDYSGDSPIDALRPQLADGGLTSSLLTAQTRLAYLDNTRIGLDSFGNRDIDATSVLVFIARAGDANLDGIVDRLDLDTLASNWQTTTASWSDADFTYDGFVNVRDLYVLATNWQESSALDEALAELGLPGVKVPEPAVVVALPICLWWSVKRPRRRF